MSSTPSADLPSTIDRFHSCTVCYTQNVTLKVSTSNVWILLLSIFYWCTWLCVLVVILWLTQCYYWTVRTLTRSTIWSYKNNSDLLPLIKHLFVNIHDNIVWNDCAGARCMWTPVCGDEIRLYDNTLGVHCILIEIHRSCLWEGLTPLCPIILHTSTTAIIRTGVIRALFVRIFSSPRSNSRRHRDRDRWSGSSSRMTPGSACMPRPWRSSLPWSAVSLRALRFVSC